MASLRRFTERFGRMLSTLLLTALYYLVLGPVALVYQRVADPLRLKRPRDLSRPAGSHWTAWTQKDDSIRLARRQD